MLFANNKIDTIELGINRQNNNNIIDIKLIYELINTI